MIFNSCDAANIDISSTGPDSVQFVEDLNLMDEITPDFGSYQEPDRYDDNGTSYSARINFTVAKDRIAQLQLVRKLVGKVLNAFVLNNNGEWKYFTNLSMRSNLSSSRSKTDLSSYSYTLFGTSTERSKFATRDVPGVILNTTWNENVDGPFAPSITASQNAKWIFENGLMVIGNSPSATGTGLDGTPQKVKLTIDDFSTITAIDFSSLKLFGTIDLSLIVFNGICDLQSNPSLTGVTFSDGDLNSITSLLLSSCDITGTLDLSNVRLTSGFLTRFNANLSLVIHSILASLNNVISGLYDVQSCFQVDVQFNDFEFNAATDTITFRSCQLTTPQVDDRLAKIDAKAVNGTATILFDGVNAAPTGGASNPSVVSLVNKGYTVIHN